MREPSQWKRGIVVVFLVLLSPTPSHGGAEVDCNLAVGSCTYTNVDLINRNDTLPASTEMSDLAEIQIVTVTKSTLTHIPVVLFARFPQLRSLDVASCGVRTLPSSFPNATGLVRLQLSHNNVTELRQMRGLPNLTHLEMSHNQIRNISSDTFEHLGGLKVLDLSHNLIETLSNGTLSPLVVLETLVMDFNRISRIEGWFRTMKKVLFISFRNNAIFGIADNAFSELQDLFHVRLSGNQLMQINIRNIDAENLDVDNNSIRSLYVHKQVKVLRLDAQSNRISKVRCDLNPKLIGLILTNNSLSELGCISKMRRLEVLYLGQNHLKLINRHSFCSLINLITLSLENNEIEFLEPGIFDQQLGLRTLILSNNRLKQFNFNIFQTSINAIDAIHLNGNNLTSITDFDIASAGGISASSALSTFSIRQALPQLTVVDVSDNDWHCSYLAMLLRLFEREQIKCLVSNELHVNEINVKGIRCRDLGAGEVKSEEHSEVAMLLSVKMRELEMEMASNRRSNEAILKKLEDIEGKMEEMAKNRIKEEF